jgi:hypothetical protein
MPEEADAFRARQLAAIRRFLEAVAANRKAAGVSGPTGSVNRKTKKAQEARRQAQGGAR